jgi:hypothetical protein
MPLPMGMGADAGMDMGGPGNADTWRKVEIPGPDEYEPPEAFRKALLEGMKDAVPEIYRQQVRRYYEELVK